MPPSCPPLFILPRISGEASVAAPGARRSCLSFAAGLAPVPQPGFPACTAPAVSGSSSVRSGASQGASPARGTAGSDVTAAFVAPASGELAAALRRGSAHGHEERAFTLPFPEVRERARRARFGLGEQGAGTGPTGGRVADSRSPRDAGASEQLFVGLGVARWKRSFVRWSVNTDEVGTSVRCPAMGRRVKW